MSLKMLNAISRYWLLVEVKCLCVVEAAGFEENARMHEVKREQGSLLHRFQSLLLFF